MAPSIRALVGAALALAFSLALAQEDTTTTTLETTTTEPTTTTAADTTTTLAVSTTEPPSTTTLPSPPTTVVPPTLAPTTTTLPAAATPCSPAAPAACDDGDPCTVDSCQGAFLTCTHRPAPDGTSCAEDGVFCTDDHCVAGTCQHVPSDGRCDDGSCVVRACAPLDPHANRAGCVLVHGLSKADRTPCTSDGVACTDDECMRGACMHMPVASRCVPHDACSAAACAPGAAGHDPDGCVVGAPRNEGDECAEDANACTVDVCRAGGCMHEPAVDDAACAPVEDAFQRTLALGTLAGEMRAELPDAATTALATARARLESVESDLGAAAQALAGKPVMGPSVAAVPATVSAIPAAERARIAFTTVLRTPREISSFLQAVAQARAAQTIERPAARHLRRRGRMLFRSTRALRAEFRVLAR